jgi:hypothetical protein
MDLTRIRDAWFLAHPRAAGREVKKILFGVSKGAIQQTMMIVPLLPTIIVGSDDEHSMCGSR